MLTRTPTRLEGMRMDLCTYKHKKSPHLEQFPQSIAPEKDLFSFSKKYWVCSVIQLSLENASERSSSEYAENTQTHHPHTVNIKTHMRINSLHIKNTHKIHFGCLFDLVYIYSLHLFNGSSPNLFILPCHGNVLFNGLRRGQKGILTWNVQKSADWGCSDQIPCKVSRYTQKVFKTVKVTVIWLA